jgi:hypothetical protein
MSSEEVRARVPGLTYRMLYTWTQNGYIACIGGMNAVVFNGGPGYSFRYERHVVPILQRMVALTTNGFSPKSASAMAHAKDGILPIGETGYIVTLSNSAGSAESAEATLSG